MDNAQTSCRMGQGTQTTRLWERAQQLPGPPALARRSRRWFLLWAAVKTAALYFAARACYAELARAVLVCAVLVMALACCAHAEAAASLGAHMHVFKHTHMHGGECVRAYRKTDGLSTRRGDGQTDS